MSIKVPNIICVCKNCGKEFGLKPWEITQGRGQYCSLKCYRTLPTRKKRSGAYKNCGTCGKEVYVSGYKLKHQKRFFCSKKCKCKAHSLLMSGKNNHNWIEDRTKLKKKYHEQIRGTKHYLGFRNDVFERDDYTCVLCGKRGNKIQAHHIKKISEYPLLVFDIDNGVTLCNKCHKNIHFKEKKYESLFYKYIKTIRRAL